jgi:hypothetical protein
MKVTDIPMTDVRYWQYYVMSNGYSYDIWKILAVLCNEQRIFL